MSSHASSEPTETQDNLIDLLDYVGHLAQLNDRVVFTLESYKLPLFHEAKFQGLPGIQNAPPDDESDVWLAIERLQRSGPPTVPDEIADWLQVSKDPNTDPSQIDLRVVHEPADKAAEMLQEDIVDEDDILLAQKPIADLPLEDCRDITLRLAKQPGTQSAIDAYSDRQWRPWSEAEKPRRITIENYEKLFSLAQMIKGDKAERPL